jgi:hypothetical protein
VRQSTRRNRPRSRPSRTRESGRRTRRRPARLHHECPTEQNLFHAARGDLAVVRLGAEETATRIRVRWTQPSLSGASYSLLRERPWVEQRSGMRAAGPGEALAPNRSYGVKTQGRMRFGGGFSNPSPRRRSTILKQGSARSWPKRCGLPSPKNRLPSWAGKLGVSPSAEKRTCCAARFVRSSFAGSACRCRQDDATGDQRADSVRRAASTAFSRWRRSTHRRSSLTTSSQDGSGSLTGSSTFGDTVRAQTRRSFWKPLEPPAADSPRLAAVRSSCERPRRRACFGTRRVGRPARGRIGT